MGALAERLEPGAIFAEDYRVVRPLAEGGMGAVYVVDQLSTGKARALKVMRPELAGDEELRRRFQQEARIGAKIESEHIVEIHSAGVDETTKAPFIVMELLVGEDLASRLCQGPLTPRQTLDLFDQLCHAVTAAHDAGIVHRDLKPENIFLARAKRAGSERSIDVKVLDFGIAKIVAESATRGKTTTGMIGTPLWMAPEQTEPGKLTPAADVWALGLILYRALTGAHYWKSASDETSTYAQILKEVCMGPMPAATIRAREQGCADRWPPELDVVFSRSVVREPMKRYRDARLFGAAVREVLVRQTGAVPSSGRVLAAPPSSGRNAAAPISGHERTELPSSSGVPERTEYAPPLPLPPKPPHVLPAPATPALLAASFGGPTEVAGIPIRALAVGVVVLLTVGAALALSVSRRSTERERERERETPSPLVLGPGGSVHTGNVATGIGGCATRFCTGEVTTTGPLDRAGVVASVERDFGALERQCLRASSPPGSATFSFTVREGKAILRQVIASSNVTARRKDPADECISRALGDVAFPANNEGTQVTYTLRWTPPPRN